MRALTKWIALCRPVADCERGATAVEYGLIIALVVLAMISALSNVATSTTNMWDNVSEEVTKH